MQSKTVLVNPAKAREWLGKMGKNRNVSWSHVRKLAQMMSNGRWVFNGQAVIFSETGELLDGQHRLQAIIMSGVEIPMQITYGVSDHRAFGTYDVTIRKRDVPQIVQMDLGIKNANSITAIARKLRVWETTEDKADFSLESDINRNIDLDTMPDYIRQNLEEIEEALLSVKGSIPYKRCKAPSALVTALIICGRADAFATMDFTNKVKNGAGLNLNSPAHVLRERLAFPPERRNGIKWDTELMALVIKSFSYHIEGKPMNALRWRQVGDAPEKFPKLKAR